METETFSIFTQLITWGELIVNVSLVHNVVCMFTVDYLVVHPISGYECDMSVSYSRIWKKTWQGLDVGHRGLGTSFKLEVAELVSVTIVASELHLSEYGY